MFFTLTQIGIVKEVSHSLPVSRPPQKALPMKRTTSITGNREHQGVRQLKTAKPNVETANSKSLFNLSYNTPNTNEPATYLEKRMEPVSSKIYKLACAPIEDSDQTAHLRSLIRVFNERSLGSQASNVSLGGKLRLL